MKSLKLNTFNIDNTYVSGNSMTIDQSKIDELCVDFSKFNILNEEMDGGNLLRIFDTMVNHPDSKDKYCYIKCLDSDIRIEFMCKYINYMLTRNYSNEKIMVLICCGGIKLGVWKIILKSCKLTRPYILYRSSYWGENKGKFSGCKISGGKFCVMNTFGLKGSCEINPCKYIYFSFNHLSVWVFPPSVVNMSRFHNKDWDKVYNSDYVFGTGIENQELEIRDLKSEIRNPGFEIRDLKLGIRDQKLGLRNQGLI